jgi:hypothetical protein
VEGGQIRISSQAFTDRRKQPSVDREALCADQAQHSQRGDVRNGVLRLEVGAIRKISSVTRTDPKSGSVTTFVPDVVPDPCPPTDLGNLAHCLITLCPSNVNDRGFDRLLDALVRLSDWAILPKL